MVYFHTRILKQQKINHKVAFFTSLMCDNFFPYMTLVFLFFQATSDSFSPRDVIFRSGVYIVLKFPPPSGWGKDIKFAK